MLQQAAQAARSVQQNACYMLQQAAQAARSVQQNACYVLQMHFHIKSFIPKSEPVMDVTVQQRYKIKMFHTACVIYCVYSMSKAQGR
jgi:hypothetical protein